MADLELISVIDNVGNIQGELTSGDTTDDTNLRLSGTVTAGLAVTIYDGNVELGEATVTGTDWTYHAALASGGSYYLNIKATDSTGNEIAVTPDFSVMTDTEAPFIMMADVTDDVGSVSGSLTSGDRTDDTSLLLSGFSEPGATVTIYDGGVYVGEVITDDDAYWAYSATLTNGEGYDFTATATDAAGNESGATASFAVTADTSAPEVSIDVVTDDVGSVTGTLTSGDRTDDTNLLLSGTVEAGSTVKVYNGDELLGDAIVESNGDWTYRASLTNGNDYQLNVKATDVAGNESDATSDFNVTVDTDIAPPSIVLDSAGEDGIYNAAELGA
ncbi:Ig-like domain-containing protein, partial [Marinomonas transparens]